MILVNSSAKLLGRLLLLACVLQAVWSERAGDSSSEDETFELDDEDERKANQFKTVCYFTNWGAHRGIKDSRMYPEDIPPELCTHILYAFGSISGTRIGHTMENDVRTAQGQGPLYERIMKLKEKNPKLKILISCGGWGKAGQFEGIVRKGARQTFSRNVIQFCRKWGFDGLDLDWEFPSGQHKKGFGELARTLRYEFQKEAEKTGKPRLMASIATAAGSYLLKTGYDIPVLCKYLDMINVMTYDLYGNWYNKVGHHSALFHEEHEQGLDRELNTNSSMYNWITSGCARHKLNIGIPTYGRAFSGHDPLKSWGAGGGGSGGLTSKYLGEAGVQTYFEVCDKLQNQGYKRYWHPVHKCAIAFKKGTWIGFDDPAGATVKCEYVKEEQFGGAMFWTLDMDDFSGKYCNEGVFPVISAVSDCFKAALTTTTTTTSTTTTTEAYVFEQFDVNDPPRRPVVDVIIQGNLLDKNSIFDYDDGDWYMLNGMMSGGSSGAVQISLNMHVLICLLLAKVLVVDRA